MKRLFDAQAKKKNVGNKKKKYKDVEVVYKFAFVPSEKEKQTEEYKNTIVKFFNKTVKYGEAESLKNLFYVTFDKDIPIFADSKKNARFVKAELDKLIFKK